MLKDTSINAVLRVVPSIAADNGYMSSAASPEDHLVEALKHSGNFCAVRHEDSPGVMAQATALEVRSQGSHHTAPPIHGGLWEKRTKSRTIANGARKPVLRGTFDAGSAKRAFEASRRQMAQTVASNKSGKTCFWRGTQGEAYGKCATDPVKPTIVPRQNTWPWGHGGAPKDRDTAWDKKADKARHHSPRKAGTLTLKYQRTMDDSMSVSSHRTAAPMSDGLFVKRQEKKKLGSQKVGRSYHPGAAGAASAAASQQRAATMRKMRQGSNIQFG